MVNLWSLAALPPGSKVYVMRDGRILCESRMLSSFRRIFSGDSRWLTVRRIEGLLATASSLSKSDELTGISKMRLLMAMHAAQNGIDALLTTYHNDMSVRLALRTLRFESDDICEALLRIFHGASFSGSPGLSGSPGSPGLSGSPGSPGSTVLSGSPGSSGSSGLPVSSGLPDQMTLINHRIAIQETAAIPSPPPPYSQLGMEDDPHYVYDLSGGNRSNQTSLEVQDLRSRDHFNQGSHSPHHD
jgi:hypothetical protein